LDVRRIMSVDLSAAVYLNANGLRRCFFNVELIQFSVQMLVWPLTERTFID